MSLASGIAGNLALSSIDNAAGLAQIRIGARPHWAHGRAHGAAELAGAGDHQRTFSSKDVLDIDALQINGSAAGGMDDDGLHVVAFPGDVTGNGSYSTLDLQRMLRVLSDLDTGFSAFQLADPVIVADVSGNGVFNSIDLTLLLREISGIDQASIPPIPGGVTPLVQGGPDPYLSLPQSVSGRPGDVITVPVNLDTAAGLESAQLRLAYDASALEVVDVRLGGLTGGFEYLIRRNEPGVLHLDMTGSQALEGGAGSLVDIDVRIKPQAPPGVQAIDLQWAMLNDGGLTLNPAPQPGPDQADGSVVVQAAPSAKPAAPAPSRTLMQSAAFEPPRVAGAQRTGQSTAPAPAIDWTARAPAFAIAPASSMRDSAPWTSDFVNSLGRSEEEANPNSKMRLKLPTVVKASPVTVQLETRGSAKCA